ncbi:MAG: methyltransferase, partial [Deltaproteobacteria bacterium]|nr:methyltransferase [Deltaproteobacteria bacterium]
KEAGPTVSSSPKSILSRFGHLVSAQGLEGLISTAFFLLLAWRDQEGYGQIMYALAAGSIVIKIIQFGLYYPLVAQLSRLKVDQAPALLNQANLIKLSLLLPTLIGLAVMVLWQKFSIGVVALVMVVGLGHALEAIAETFFAHLRVQGQQAREAKIKIFGSLLAYGYGLIGVTLGWPSLLIGGFKLISGVVWISLGVKGLVKSCIQNILVRVDRPQIWLLFRTAAIFALTQILGTVYNKTNIFFLEKAAGVKGVAYYSAAYSLVDPISTLASEQLLGAVVFPMLAVLWWKDRQGFGRLIHGSALWLLAIAWPIMFVLFVESDFLIGLIYPAEYHDAIWMQKYLTASIFLSFENNLFAYVMMVTEGVNMLLVFSVIVTIFNLLFNIILVKWSDLTGACLVIVLTKLTMTMMTMEQTQNKNQLQTPDEDLLDEGLYRDAYMHLGLLNIQRVADLGCGSGLFVKVLSERLNRKEVYWGVDVDMKKLETARNRFPGWTFAFGDFNAKNTRAEFGKYDAFLMIKILDYIKDDQGLIAGFPSGTPLVFSLAGFEAPGCVRWFKQKTEVYERYSGLLDIKLAGITRRPDKNFWHMITARRW